MEELEQVQQADGRWPSMSHGGRTGGAQKPCATLAGGSPIGPRAQRSEVGVHAGAGEEGTTHRAGVTCECGLFKGPYTAAANGFSPADVGDELAPPGTWSRA